MHVVVVKDAAEAGRIVAADIKRLVKADKNMVLGLATGSSPLAVYAELRRMYQDGEIDLSGVTAFALDEYVGLPADHPEGYRNVLRTELIGSTGLTEEHLNTPNGAADDPESAAAEYDQAIKNAGGIRYQLLGIGSDGHIAFNEPCGPLASRTHTSTLTDQTRSDNARFFDGDIDKVPTLALTQGLGTIMDAHEVALMAFGAKKATAIAQLIEGSVSARWPATVLQYHNHATVLVDEAAASKLQLRDYFQQMWEKERAAAYTCKCCCD